MSDMIADSIMDLHTKLALTSILGAKILLVEDDRLNQEVAHHILFKAGFKVTTADNGLIASKIVQNESFDLVLMDVQMPEMDGIAAACEIRNLYGCLSLPIIAMTANTSHRDRVDCLVAGMNDCLFKPIDPQELWRMLVKWIPPMSKSEVCQNQEAVHLNFLPRQPETHMNMLMLQVMDGISGLATTDALRRVNGDIQHFAELLIRFAKNHLGIGDAICKALARDDKFAAQLITHNLKGVAGTLGLIKIQSVADDLDNILRYQDKKSEMLATAECLARLLEEVVPSIESLNKLITPLNQVDDFIESELLCVQMLKLRSLLASDDLQSSKFIKKLFPCLLENFGEQAELLMEYVNNFRMIEALSLLDKIIDANAAQTVTRGEYL